jgi:hypothetical protein
MIAVPHDFTLEINDQHEVIITVRCPDAYAAMELHDLIKRDGERGLVNLVVVTDDEP